MQTEYAQAYFETGNLCEFFNRRFPHLHFVFQGVIAGLLIFSFAIWFHFIDKGQFAITVQNVLDERPWGVGLHFPTIIFACCAYLFLSKYAQKRGVVGLNNVLFGFFVVFASMMPFEWVYIITYDLVHNGGLAWGIVTYGLVGNPKFYNVVFQNGFGLIGGILLAWWIVKPYKVRFNKLKLKLFLFVPFILSMLFWIYYPYPTQVATSPTFGTSKGGGLFPQQIYIWYDPVSHEIVDQIVFHDFGIFMLNWLAKGLSVLAFAGSMTFNLEYGQFWRQKG